MSTFCRVATAGEIPEGEGRAFPVGERMVAVFNVKGQYFAIDDMCPHMGASLADGYLAGCVVTCPLHAWRFDVRDGTWCDNPRVATDHFGVVCDGEDILVTTQPVPRKQ